MEGITSVDAGYLEGLFAFNKRDSVTIDVAVFKDKKQTDD
jgi:hypothetical protein